MNLRSTSKETFMIVYGSEVFRPGSFTVRDPFSTFAFLSYTFMHSRGPRKQLRDSRKKNGPLFIEFTIFHVSSRGATFIPRGSRFVFRSYDSPGTHCASCGYLTGRTEERRDGGTLHYNYSVKKFKSLNTVCRTTIPTVLKLRGTRIRLCKRGESRLM